MNNQPTQPHDKPESLPEYIDFVSNPATKFPSTVKRVDIPDTLNVTICQEVAGNCDSKCVAYDRGKPAELVSIFDIWNIPHDSEVYHVEAVGNSMEPYITEGCEVFFIPSKLPNPKNTVVVEYQGACLIKDLFYFDQLHSWWLCSRNREHLPIPLTVHSDYLFLGTVIHVRKPVDKPDTDDMTEQVKAFLGISDLRAASKHARIIRVIDILGQATDAYGNRLICYAQDWAFVFRIMAEHQLFEYNSYTDFVRYMRSDQLNIDKIPHHTTLCHILSGLRGLYPNWVKPDYIRDHVWPRLCAIGAYTEKVLSEV